MISYAKLLTCCCSIFLASTIASIQTSSCLPGVPGTCGCCDSTTTCIEIPYTVLPFVTPNYICLLNDIAKNFSFAQCNCTVKDPPLCLCFSRTQAFPVYSQCDSFTECAIADIQVKGKQQIYSKFLSSSSTFFSYTFFASDFL